MRRDHSACGPGDHRETGCKGVVPHRLVEACIRVMYISYGVDHCGNATVVAPHKDVGAACGNP
jgi:hypothetical protein